MPNDLLPFVSTLVEISTLHLSKDDVGVLDRLARAQIDPLAKDDGTPPDVRVIKYAEGWFVWKFGERAFLKGFSQPFRATLAGLFQCGARYVRLDADAPVLAQFHRFEKDWK